MIQRKKNTGIIILVIILLAGVAYGASLVTSRYLDDQYASLHQGCRPPKTKHEVVIENGRVSPQHTNASKCDTFTIKNNDDEDRIMAFGVHDEHIAYDGIEEQELRGRGEFTVTLIQVGDFKFHDHMHDEVKGTFTVN